MSQELSREFIPAAFIDEINREIDRQESLRLAGKFRDTCRTAADITSFAIVGEELGEIAELVDVEYIIRAIRHYGNIGRGLNDDDRQKMREEIVQTIACLIQWWFKIDDVPKVGKQRI